MIRARLGLLLVGTIALACTRDVEGLQDASTLLPDAEVDAGADAAIDAGHSVWETGLECEYTPQYMPTFRVPAGMIFADGCNECGCGPGTFAGSDCTATACMGSCTSAACLPTQTATCSAHSSCTNGLCFFEPGCGAPTGHCAYTQTRCHPPAKEWDPTTAPDPFILFCGCDGKTYEDRCPMVPYAHTGPCP